MIFEFTCQKCQGRRETDVESDLPCNWCGSKMELTRKYGFEGVAHYIDDDVDPEHAPDMAT